MTANIRAFLAIELPNDVKHDLAGLVQQLRNSHIACLRPVAVESIHLTLKFFGEIPASSINQIVEKVTEVVKGVEPFTLSLAGIGSFPGNKAPRVVWVGLVGDLNRLTVLQFQIDEALLKIGFKKEERKFSPHLTIARLGEQASSFDRQKVGEFVSSAHFTSNVIFTVASVSLMQSILKPQGAIYNCIALMPLSS